MKNQGNVSLPPSHHSNSTSESKDNDLVEMSERQFRSLLLLIYFLKEETNKQINEVRKSIQNQDKKVNNREGKFNKEMEIMNNNQVEILEMKTLINQIQTTLDSMINRQDQKKKNNVRDGEKH
jgi:hypothetical protein